MSETPVNFSTGLGETVLPDESFERLAALEAALGADDKRSALAKVAAANPQFLDAWAHLSENGTDQVECYAFARVGYHRGLDALRRSGWRGSGFVRWQHPSNQGFLRSLEGLRRSAEAIGEAEEAERCALFLRQCDPKWTGIPA